MEEGGGRTQTLREGEKGYHVPSSGDDTAIVVTHTTAATLDLYTSAHQ